MKSLKFLILSTELSGPDTLSGICQFLTKACKYGWVCLAYWLIQLLWSITWSRVTFLHPLCLLCTLSSCSQLLLTETVLQLVFLFNTQVREICSALFQRLHIYCFFAFLSLLFLFLFFFSVLFVLLEMWGTVMYSDTRNWFQIRADAACIH